MGSIRFPRITAIIRPRRQTDLVFTSCYVMSCWHKNIVSLGVLICFLSGLVRILFVFGFSDTSACQEKIFYVAHRLFDDAGWLYTVKNVPYYLLTRSWHTFYLFCFTYIFYNTCLTIKLNNIYNIGSFLGSSFSSLLVITSTKLCLGRL